MFTERLYVQQDDKGNLEVYDDPGKVPAGKDTAEYQLKQVGQVKPVFEPVKRERKPRKDNGTRLCKQCKKKVTTVVIDGYTACPECYAPID